MFLGGNTTWQSVSSFGGGVGWRGKLVHEEKPQRPTWRAVVGFTCSVPILTSSDKNNLVLIWRTRTPSQSTKFGQNSKVLPLLLPAPRVVTWLRFKQSEYSIPYKDAHIGKVRSTRLYCQTLTEHFGKESSLAYIISCEKPPEATTWREPNYKWRQRRAEPRDGRQEQYKQEGDPVGSYPFWSKNCLWHLVILDFFCLHQLKFGFCHLQWRQIVPCSSHAESQRTGMKCDPDSATF